MPGEVFIKLEIEGGEYAFLNGASQFIASHRPRILMEVNPTATEAAGTDPAAFVKLLKKLHYTSFAYVKDLSTQQPIDSLSFTKQRDILLTAEAHG